MSTDPNNISQPDNNRPNNNRKENYFSCNDIHAYYGESYIVQGVSFSIHEREILALLGRNGAGKSSTLRTIARLDEPELQQGEIWLDGNALHKICLLYTSPSPRDGLLSRMPSSA